MDYVGHARGFVQVSLLTAGVLYLVFAVYDRLVMPPETLEVAFAIRVGVFFGLIGVSASVGTRFFARYMQPVLGAVLIVGGSVLVAFVGLGARPEMYGGLVICCVYAHTMLRLRFVWATAVTTVLIVLYEIVAWPLTAPTVMASNNFILISTNVTGMVGSYWMEHYLRRVFWQRRLLHQRHRALLTEDRRKGRELEAARQMQRAMLPPTVPELPGLRVGVWMQPAFEVGGDFYDVHMRSDGAVFFAIGDATGHGMQASTAVTVAKTVLTCAPAEADLVARLRQLSHVLERMGLPGLYMAMAVGRFDGHTLEIAGAGMPPGLIRRAASGRVDEVPLKGAPLGFCTAYPYVATRYVLYPGDVLLLMSDGFAETFSPSKEMVGYDAAARLLAACPDTDPDVIIRHLRRFAETWAGTRPIDDDTTFLAFSVQPVDASVTVDNETPTPVWEPALA